MACGHIDKLLAGARPGAVWGGCEGPWEGPGQAWGLAHSLAEGVFLGGDTEAQALGISPGNPQRLRRGELGFRFFENGNRIP